MFKVFVSVAIFMLALITAAEQASAQVGVAVYVNNNTAAKVKGIFQSTDFGDSSMGCVAQSGTGSSQCKESRNYSKPPKNIKNLLCIASNMKWQPTQKCTNLLQAVSGCKRNDIWTSLCGAGYGINVVPKCIYRTDSGQFSSWSWTVWATENKTDSLTVDCAIDNYSVLKK